MNDEVVDMGLSTRYATCNLGANSPEEPGEYIVRVSIPQSETVMAVIALGYREVEPTRPRHKELDEIVKFF